MSKKSSNANIIPNGLYHIRDGLVSGKDNYVTAVRNPERDRYDLFVKEEERDSLWVIQATGDGETYMIYPRFEAFRAVSVLEHTGKPFERELGAVAMGEVNHNQQVWVFTQGGRGQYAISNFSDGLRISWTWSGNREDPMIASPSNRLYIIEQVE